MPPVLEIQKSSQNLLDEPSLVAENSKRRHLKRAQMDGSIQRQLRREKMAEERRKKLATLNSQISWQRSREESASSEVTGKTDELGKCRAGTKKNRLSDVFVNCLGFS